MRSSKELSDMLVDDLKRARNGHDAEANPAPKPTPLAPARRGRPKAVRHMTTETHAKGADSLGPAVDAIVVAKPTAHPPKRRGRLSVRHSSLATHGTSADGLPGAATPQVKPDERAPHRELPLHLQELVQAARLRRRLHRAEKSLVLQSLAMCRAFCDGDKGEAAKMWARIKEGNEPRIDITMAFMPFLSSIQIFAEQRAAVEKELRLVARALPIWLAHVKAVKGFGDLRLALIVGECGDIGSYRSVSGLWKRMGLAVINGERQRKKTDPDEAKAHGYNAERRSMAYVLGTEIMKAQLRAPRDDEGRKTNADTIAIGPLGEVYINRRLYEANNGIEKAHAHNRAARFMVKRVLRELYGAWHSMESNALSGRGTHGRNEEREIPEAGRWPDEHRD
jgi:hypothetical protein